MPSWLTRPLAGFLLLLVPAMVGAEPLLSDRLDSDSHTSLCQRLALLDRDLLARVESHNRYPILDYPIEVLSLVTPFVEVGYTLERLWTGYVHDRREARKTGWIVCVALAGTQTVSLAMKYAIGRPRPHPDRAAYRPRLPNTRLTPSFPSGHTASSFAFAAAVGAEHRSWRLPLLAYASLSGYSHLYVGNHYPSDVLAGALLGSTAGMLTSAQDTWFVLHFGL